MNDRNTKIKNRVWMIIAFIIFFLSIFLIAALSAYLTKNPGEKIAPASWGNICALSGLGAGVCLTVLYALLLRPLDKINIAMKQVAKGNFKATLNHSSPIPGLKNMRESFNIMTQELSGTETLRSDFIAAVSHEFKTPIAAIEGYATLLKKEIDEEERNFYVDKIISNVSELSDLTGNILRLSKLENQKIVPDKKRFLLDEEIRHAVLFLEKKWTEKNIDLNLDLPRTEFYGDPDLIRTVFINLLSNAFKFTPEGGRVSVSLVKGERTTVTVSDTGIGIEEKNLDKIFDKFYQVDPSHSAGGSGLGLAIVKRIVELSGGRVRVESSLGEGSAFIVEL